MKNDLKKLVDELRIAHPVFKEGLARLSQLVEDAKKGVRPDGLVIIGESRAGKSTLLEEFEEKYRARRDEEGEMVPVLIVTTPSKPTVKGLVEEILQALGDEEWDAGTQRQQTARLRKLLCKCGTLVLALDEFQHFVDKGSLKVLHDVADWLKTLIDSTKVSLVVTGLPRCMAVFQQNEQLMGRVQAPFIMPRFQWKKPTERAQFKGIVSGFYAEVEQHFKLPNLDDGAMLFRCYCATGGLVGYVARFLHQVVSTAVNQDKAVITLEDMEVALERAIWSKARVHGIENPFSKGFKPDVTDELLDKVMLIGAAVEPPMASRRKRSSAGRELTVGEILGATR